MGCYRHLMRDDREEIAALRAAGHSMRAVAAAVGKAPSSISHGFLELWEERRFAVIHVSHSLQDVAYLSDRVIVFSEKPTTVSASVPI
ncbi:MAG: helix-turn-helix domain-containing protein, partial [Gammaproteobacteria bacterium]|nr:helix-turn-helix domain-containing protein [Gammaproteobacteria bacterium]